MVALETDGKPVRKDRSKSAGGPYGSGAQGVAPFTGRWRFVSTGLVLPRERAPGFSTDSGLAALGPFRKGGRQENKPKKGRTKHKKTVFRGGQEAVTAEIAGVASSQSLWTWASLRPGSRLRSEASASQAPALRGWLVRRRFLCGRNATKQSETNQNKAEQTSSLSSRRRRLAVQASVGVRNERRPEGLEIRPWGEKIKPEEEKIKPKTPMIKPN
jgi:hypothetical protein